jgi:hypothetical protein
MSTPINPISEVTPGSNPLLAVSETSVDSEFYSPIPPGYQRGAHKYVVILGTVMSALGKGIFSSSLAKLFKEKGLTVAPIKMEGLSEHRFGYPQPLSPRRGLRPR